MIEGRDYIATWFYRESPEEASFYPQGGGWGDSALVHSVYMQLLVPFLTTFHHYNPEAKLLFFTNLGAHELPAFITRLLLRTDAEIVSLPYTHRPPKGWYKAWMNQFYLYDILEAMEKRMGDYDVVLVCDADCLCRKPLDDLFYAVRKYGSALYDVGYPRTYPINGTSMEQMEGVYSLCYSEPPSTPLRYYGGEFIALGQNAVAGINREYSKLWEFNLGLPAGGPRIHEEAQMLSLLAERLHIRNNIGNKYVKRMWTGLRYNNVKRGDENLAVWHLPAEKRSGLYRLYLLLEQQRNIRDEEGFWKKAGEYTGVPCAGIKKIVWDLYHQICVKWQKA